MKFKFLGKLAIAGVLSFFVSAPAFAETSNWMRGGDAIRYAYQLGQKGMIVTDLECRDSGSPGYGLKSALVKFTYTRNTANIAWRVDGWMDLERNKAHWERKGYHLKKYGQFSRKKSGQRLYCTLYYK